MYPGKFGQYKYASYIYVPEGEVGVGIEDIYGCKVDINAGLAL
jgi:hypothetical protein